MRIYLDPHRVLDRVKSPSDTTIYAPALNKRPNRYTQHNFQIAHTPVLTSDADIRPTIDKISDFVDAVRLEDERKRNSSGASEHRVRSKVVVPDKTLPLAHGSQREDGRGVASGLILEAEKFRVDVVCPQGNDQLSNKFFEGVREPSQEEIVDDDEFFHVTCNVDKVLSQKNSERGKC